MMNQWRNKNAWREERPQQWNMWHGARTPILAAVIAKKKTVRMMMPREISLSLGITRDFLEEIDLTI
jgi:hypothetical protein